MLEWARNRGARHFRQQSDEDRLVTECESFLTGSLALARISHGECPRPWEWVNMLARGSEESLRRVVKTQLPAATSPRDAEWQSATKFIAQLVTDEVTIGSFSFEELQHRVLMPLEADVPNEDGGVAAPPHPSWMVRHALASLERLSHQPQE